MTTAPSRYIALIMALVMCFSLVPAYAFADDTVEDPMKITDPAGEELIGGDMVDIISTPEPEIDKEPGETQSDNENKAEEKKKDDLPESGTCGENLTWTLEKSGTLTISGTGKMTDFSDDADLPWIFLRDYIKSVIINAGVTTIGENAFYKCFHLTGISLPAGLTSIGKCAFEFCEALKSVTIPESVTEISEYAFSECISLTAVKIPDNVTSIGDNAFFGCEKLSKVTVGKGVKEIGTCVFHMCESLTEINVSEENSAFSSEDGVLFNSNKRMLICCPGAKEGTYTIPDSVLIIGAYAFAGCEELTAITIPDNVTSIGKYAFYGCESLESAVIPDRVSSLGEYAFSGCEELTELLIGSRVSVINTGTCFQCSSLSTVAIPSRVTEICAYAFFLCEIADIYYCGTPAQWDMISVGDNNGSLERAGRHFVTKSYTVSYDANGGTGAPEAQTKYHGQPLALSNTIPECGDYSFLGWAASPTAANAQYKPGDSYTIEEDVTLFAVWKHIPATKLTVTPESANLYDAGQQVQLSVSILPQDASRTVIWTSSDNNIATVSVDGVVTATGVVGSADITATAADGSKKSAKCSIKVVQSVEDLTLTAPQSAVLTGKSVQFKAAVTPSNAAVKKVTWSFDAGEELSEYITLNNGKLSIRKDLPAEYAGTVTVTATAIGCTSPLSKSFSIDVVAPVSEITVKSDGETVDPKVRGALWIGEKENVRLSAEILPAQACQQVVWKSSSEKIASVDENGLVTAHAKGTATISATSCDGAKESVKYTIRVGVPAKTVSVTSSETYVARGKSLTPKATVFPADVSDKTVRWELVTPTDMVTINEKSGKLTVSKDWDGEPAQVTVRAYANGTSRTDVYGEMTIDIISK